MSTPRKDREEDAKLLASVAERRVETRKRGQRRRVDLQSHHQETLRKPPSHQDDEGSPLSASSSPSHLPLSPLVTPPGRGTSAAYAQHHTPANDTGEATEASYKSRSKRRIQEHDTTTPAEKKSSPPHSPSRGVPHVYHDYSQVPDLLMKRKKTGGVLQPFPEKLHEMLDATESDPDMKRIVSWLPHGRAFIVHIPRDFTEHVMPRFFRQTKLTSFQRQLNLYGFRRITQGRDAGAYYHEKFLRGRLALSQSMVRQKVKGTGHKQPADASSEPNFYDMATIVNSSSISQVRHQEEESIPRVSVLSPSRQTARDGYRMDTSAVSQEDKAPVVHGFVVESSTATGDVALSPGMQSVRGAADLLRDIAAGAFLGTAASAEEGGNRYTLTVRQQSSPPPQGQTSRDDDDVSAAASRQESV